MATTGGQTINDRLNAVRYALVGQGLARTVCKATTEEVLGPKKKHIDYLLACTNEPNVSVPQMANLLIERTQHTSWAVVFKALTTIHHLMSFGNERFTQYLATSNHSFELADFMDRTTPQGYNMSNFVRRYAKYINDKSISYRTLAIDLCKIKSGNDNALRTMNMDNLSKTLPIVQAQFDSLLDFNVESKDLNNGIIMAAFRLLYKDLVRLYIAYQEAIINLLERYFKLSRKKTREALEMYKNYLNRMDKVANFLKIVEAVGLDKSEMPDLTKSPASILKLLEQHLATLEAKKRGTTPAGEDDTADGSVSANKEEEQQASSSKTSKEDKENIPPNHQSDGSEVRSDKKTPSSDLPTQQSAAAATNPQQQQQQQIKSSSSSNQNKQPPAKPNRPVTPEVSPKAKDKSIPIAQTEKKPAPERPAKPPSRPPPPSANSPVESASKRTVSPATTAPAASSSGDSPKATSSTSRPTPPPHPPPPPSSSSSSTTNTSRASAAAGPAAAPSAPAASQAPITQNGQDQPNGTHMNGRAESNANSCSTTQQQEANGTSDYVGENNADSNYKYTDLPTTTTTGTCSTTENQTTSQNVIENNQAILNNSNNVGTNHVHVNNDENHNNNDHQAEELPSPPPPIDDDEMPPPPPPIDDQGVSLEQHEQEVVSEQPIVNGSSSNDNVEAVEQREGHEEVGDLGIGQINLQEETGVNHTNE